MVSYLISLVLLASNPLDLAIHNVWQAERGKPEMTAYVTVSDIDGKQVTGLSARDFRVLCGRDTVRPITVQNLIQDRDTMAVGLLIDRSGSMRGSKIIDARQAAIDFLGQLGRNDQVAVISVGDEVEFLTGFTGDRTNVTGAVNSLEARSNRTKLYDALFFFMDSCRQSPRKLTALVLLTDGIDDGSRYQLDYGLRIAQELHIPVYTIGFGADVNSDTLEMIANVTRGRFHYAPTSAGLLDIYRTVAGQLKSWYRLDFRTPGQGHINSRLNVLVQRGGLTAQDEQAYKAYVETGHNTWLIIIIVVLALLALGAVVLVLLLTRRKPEPPVATPPPPLFVPPPPVPDQASPADTQQFAGPPPVGLIPAPGVELGRRGMDTMSLKPVLPVKAELVVKTGPKVGETHSIRPDDEARFDVKIGRAEDNDFIIPDDTVSRRHAKVVYKRGEFELWDLASSGGTFRNGQPVAASCELKDGDIIRLANRVEIVFKVIEPERPGVVPLFPEPVPQTGAGPAPKPETGPESWTVAPDPDEAPRPKR